MTHIWPFKHCLNVLICYYRWIDLNNKFHYEPVPYPTMLHSEQKCAHFCSEWSIVVYGIGAFWDLWNWPIVTGVMSEQYQINLLLHMASMPHQFVGWWYGKSVDGIHAGHKVCLKNYVHGSLWFGNDWLNPLHVTFFIGDTKMIMIYIIPPHWHDKSSWNPSSYKRQELIYSA